MYSADEECKGRIINIQRFSVFDGPGVRTVVFFKGCSLRCLWCHNPESLEYASQLSFDRTKCIGCGSCVTLCPTGSLTADAAGQLKLHDSTCTGCGSCAAGCYAKALQMIGYDISAETLVRQLLEDEPYYRQSGMGGVTFSGGECMLQPAFLKEVLKRLKACHIHTAVDTAGNVEWENFERILPYTDLFLYDLKAYDTKVHRKLTNAGNERILDNLRKLKAAHAAMQIRIPVVPGQNTQELPAIRQLLNDLEIRGVLLLPYHPMGVGKGELLLSGDRQRCFEEPAPEIMDEYRRRMGEVTIHGSGVCKTAHSVRT